MSGKVKLILISKEILQVQWKRRKKNYDVWSFSFCSLFGVSPLIRTVVICSTKNDDESMHIRDILKNFLHSGT